MKKKILSVALGATAVVVAGATLTGCKKGVDLNKLIEQVILTNDGAKITDDFSVPSYVSNGKKNYMLKWESDNTDLLSFSYVDDNPETKDVDESLEDATAIVTRPADEMKEVTFRAYIKSGKKTVKSADFSVRIERQLTPEEQFKYYYDNAAEKKDANLTGYIIAKAGWTTYQGKGEACLYIASDVYDAGAYYIYNAYIEQDEYNALAVGDYVTVKGTKFTVYNGIVEVSGGNIEKDASKTPLTAEQVAAKTVDITDTVIASTNRDADLLYIQGHNVKLNGAKVVEVSAEKYSAATGKYLSTMQNIITVEVNGNKLDVVVEEGLTPFAEAGTKTIFEEVQKFKVGDYVNVEGYLVGTAAIAITAKTKVVKETTVPTWGKVADVVAENTFTNFFAEAATLDLATKGVSTEDVAITWALKGTPETVKIEDGKLVVTPVKDKEEKVTLIGTFTLGEFTKTVEYKFSTLSLTKAEQLEYEAKKLKYAEAYKTYDEDVVLNANGVTLKNVALAYEITEGTSAAKIEDGKLVFLSVEATTDVKLKVTLTIDAETTPLVKEFTFTVANPELTTFKAPTTFEKGAFKVTYKGTDQYFTGAMKDTYYLETTTIGNNAKEVFTEAVEGETGKYRLYVMDGEKKNYIVAYVSGNYTDMAMSTDITDAKLKEITKVETFNTVFTIDADGVIKTTITKDNETKTYFLANKEAGKAYARLAIQEVSNMGGAGFDTVYFKNTEKKAYTKDEKAQYELDNISNELTQKSTLSYALDTTPSIFTDAEITYTVKEGDTTGTTITDGKITFGVVLEGEVNVTVVAAVSVNGSTPKTKEITFKVTALDYKTPTEAITAEPEAGDTLFVTGTVCEVNAGAKKYYITDGSSVIMLYGDPDSSTAHGVSELTVGKTIKCSGAYELYGTDHEIKTWKVYEVGADVTDLDKARVTAIELAVPNYLEDKTDVALATAGTTYNTATIAWALKGTSNTVTLGENKYTVKRGAEKEVVTFVATVTQGTATVTREISFTVYDVNTLLAKANVTANKTGANIGDLTAGLNLDSTKITVTYTKGNPTSDVAIRTDGIRMYGVAGDAAGNSFTFTAAAGYKIDSIVINFDSANYGKCAVVKVGDNTVTATKGVYTINGSAFTLVNDNTSATSNTQVRWQSIEIHVSAVQNA